MLVGRAHGHDDVLELAGEVPSAVVVARARHHRAEGWQGC